MANQVHEQTVALRNQTLSSLRRMYDAVWQELYGDIELLIERMYLEAEGATQRERLKYAEKNGKDELIGLFVAAVVLVNSGAIKRINTGLDNIYTVNAKDVTGYIRRVTGVDMAAKGVDINKLLSKYTRRSYNASMDKVHVSRDILHEIDKMLNAGDGTKKISARLEQKFYGNKISADRTALTETTRIQSRGRLDTMREAEKRGMKFKKIWRHSYYVENPRDWHVELDGIAIELNDLFITAMGNPMDCPGDPNAPAEEVCNCHCFLDEELVDW